MEQLHVAIVLGTRPEAIKLSPFLSPPPGISVSVCSTGQHRELLTPMLDFFGYSSVHDLAACSPGQSLSNLTAKILPGLENWLQDIKPNIVFVQGDTQSAFAGALAAYYQQIPVAHIEAGLRTETIYSPFPEEMNRRLIGRIATWHFTPTPKASEALYKEGVCENVVMVGNTGIDALYQTVPKALPPKCFLPKKDLIFVTTHRRENHGPRLENICQALKKIADTENCHILLPVHKNPVVQKTVAQLSGHPNISLIDPLGYPETVWLLSQCRIVLTDSGGLQEEAPALNKPVLVLREDTEREEGVIAGCARLVGTDADTIVRNTRELLNNQACYDEMANSPCPYGRGEAAKKIWDYLLSQRSPRQLAAATPPQRGT